MKGECEPPIVTIKSRRNRKMCYVLFCNIFEMIRLIKDDDHCAVDIFLLYTDFIDITFLSLGYPVYCLLAFFLCIAYIDGKKLRNCCKNILRKDVLLIDLSE